MATPKIVYFDTNAVRDLSELRNQITIEKVDGIKHHTKKGELVVAPSFEVPYEIISSPNVNEETRNKNAEFYDTIVDWKYALKPSQEMLENDICNLIRTGGPSTPYCALDADQSGFIQSIRKGAPIFPNVVIEDIIKESRYQTERFIQKVFKDFLRQLPAKAKEDLRNNPEQIWEQWWKPGGFAEIIGEDLAGDKHVSGEFSVLSLPTVRSAVGYLLNSWYRQIVNGASPKPTDHYDFRNAILAAGVGRIVTQDRKLRNAINHVPDLNVGVWTLCELIDELNQSVK